MSTKVRDGMWLWGHQVDAHFTGYNIDRHSRITPAEAAMYLNIPNIMMVDLGKAEPLPPVPQEALAVSTSSKVVWSIRHPGREGKDRKFELEAILKDVQAIHELSAEHENICGVILDDFHMELTRPGMSPEVLGQLRTKVREGREDFGLYVVVYDYLLDSKYWDYMPHVDSVTLWTWRNENLGHLEKTFDTCRERIGDKELILGLYLYDYGAKQEMPLDQMRYQCDFALKQLQQGNISGMIFLASCICDLGFETIPWTRDWIRDVGDSTI